MQKTTIQRLKAVYRTISDYDSIPKLRDKANWNNANKFGFLKGMIEYGQTQHLTELDNLLKNQKNWAKLDNFIDRMFEFYIVPFHKSYSASRAVSTLPPGHLTAASSKTGSTSSSVRNYITSRVPRAIL